MKKNSISWWVGIITLTVLMPTLAFGWAVRPRDLAGGTDLTPGSNVAISSNGLEFTNGTAGGSDAETIQGIPITAPAIGDVGKYIEVGSGATTFIYGTPAGGGDMSASVWDGDSNGYIDLDAGGTNSYMADPNADRLMGWVDASSGVSWYTLSTGLTLSSKVLTLDTELQAISGVTSAANKLPYFTGSGSADVADLTAVARNVIASGTTTAMRTNLGLAIGTDVQAYDAELAALAGLTSAANKVPYFTGSGSANVTDLSAVAINVIASGTTSAMRTNLGLAIGSDVQAYNADLAAIAGGTWTGAASITTVGTIATGVWSGTAIVKGKVASDLDTSNLAAVLTFADGDLVDLSSITMTAGADEGLVLPTYANVTPASDKKFLAVDGSNLMLYNGGWVTIGATAAPTSAQYLTLAADATLTQERKFTVGFGLTGTESTGSGVTNYTLAVSPSGVTGANTWSDGSTATIAWTFNVSTGTDPVVTAGNNYINVSTGALQVSGNTVYYLGGTDVAVADGGTAKSSWTQYALIYPDTTTSFSQIAVGSSGQLLQSGGGAAPGWTTATYPTTSGTSGYFLRSDGTNFVSLAPSSFSLDDIAEGSTYQRVAAADVSASGHINRWQVADTAGYATIAGPTGAVVITVDNASQTLAARNTANTFTENNTFGNADTDTLTIRSLIIGGNSRAVWIASTAPSPTYATGTTEFYVEGDMEVGGTTYSSGGFVSTGSSGDSYISLNDNTTYTPSSGYRIYFEGGAFKVYDGTEKNILDTASAPALTGATWNFASVTNMSLPNTTVDAAGEIGINRTTHTLNLHAGGSSADNAVQTFDFDTCSNGYILKTNGSGSWTCAEDATGGTPAWDTIGNPTGTETITFPSGATTSFLYTAAFTAAQGSQFLIEQKTGNPTGGVLFEVKGADSDITIAKFGDGGSNVITITSAGAMVLGGTATISAGGVVLGDSVPDANGEIGYATNAYAFYANSEDMLWTAGTDTWTYSSNTGANLVLGNTSATNINVTSGVTVGAVLWPDANDGAALGTTSYSWSDLFLASGGVVNWNAGDVTLTHSANTLAFAGASTGYTFDSGVTVTGNINATTMSATTFTGALTGNASTATTAGTVTTAAQPTITSVGTLTGLTIGGAIIPSITTVDLGSGTSGFSTIYGKSGAVINFNAGDVTLTHAANSLAFAGGTYTFDSGVTVTGNVGATTFTGALTGAVTGNASSATLAATMTVVDSTDATSYVAIFDSASGSLAVKTDSGVTYDATTGMLYATGFTGPLTGNATTATSAGSVTNATLTTALTVNTGTVALVGNAANNSSLTLPAGSFVLSGTTEYVLKAQGVGVAPIWAAVAVGGGDFMADGSIPMTAAIIPNAVNTIALGSSLAEWSDLYLGDGAVIYGQNDSSATLTSSASTWTANNFAVSGNLVVTGQASGGAKAYSVLSGVTNATQLSDVTGVSTLVAAEVNGTIINIDSSGVTRFTLPTPASGYNTIFVSGISGVTVQIESGTTMYVNGTATATGGVGAQIVSITPGEYFSCLTAHKPSALADGTGQIEWMCRKITD